MAKDPSADLKEFTSAYVAEVEEQLQAANARLLDIETAVRENKDDPRAVRDLFRAVHTIKGLSAMVGVEPAVSIAHRMESILRISDRSGGKLAPHSIDTLLQALRAIHHRVREVAERKEPTAAPNALLEALDQLEPGRPENPVAGPATLDLDESLAAKLASFEISLLVDGARAGRRAVRVDFSPSPSRAERGFSINTVRERIGSIGEIIKVLPISVRASTNAPGALTFAILLLTSASDEELGVAADVAPSSIVSVVHVAPATPLDVVPAQAPAVHEDLQTDDPETSHRRNVVRVEVTRLDDAMEHLSTLIVTRSRLVRAVAAMTAAGVNTRDLSEIVRDNARQLRDLRAALLRVRMVPLTEVLDRIPLLLRGLRRESGKQVRLKLDAGAAELDKGVAERVFPALVHLVRNAVDHAIELPAERVQAGKNAEGMLRIACHAHSNTRLELTITDDGRGVDREALSKRTGRELTTDTAVLDALCRAGFSTRDVATTTSGRGMGMDIVKRIVVDQLGGELTMKSVPGEGTTFTLRVPLTISIVDAFTMECSGQRFVVPVAMVEEILDVTGEHGARVREGPRSSGIGMMRARILALRGETVPMVDLASALRLGTEDRHAPQALLVRRAGQPIAFALDRVVGQQEAVVRPLVDPLVQSPGIAGATDLGDGKPTLVLDLVALAATLDPRNGHRAA